MHCRIGKKVQGRIERERRSKEAATDRETYRIWAVKSREKFNLVLTHSIGSLKFQRLRLATCTHTPR
jgi:hypothetical protein